MTTKTLELIKTMLTGANLNYAFHTLKSTSVTYPYWIGEYIESSPNEETGFRQSTFILTGTTNTTWGSLQTNKTTIEDLFRNKKAIHSDGTAVAFFIENSLEVPTELDTLKKIQINISVLEWRN